MREPNLTARSVIESLAECNLPCWDEIESTAVSKNLQKGEALFHAGQTRPFIFVITRGIVKMVYETADGNCWIKAFATAGTCFASITALAPQGVTSFSVYAVTEAQAEQLDYRKLQQLASRHLGWQRAIGKAFELYGRRKEQREMELLTLTAEERYLRFLDEYRQIEPLVTQKDIASYIRITPIALSRIKARLRMRL
jgi:CRP-like cAMP-binding protein